MVIARAFTPASFAGVTISGAKVRAANIRVVILATREKLEELKVLETLVKTSK
jgi:hypothetical protein